MTTHNGGSTSHQPPSTYSGRRGVFPPPGRRNVLPPPAREATTCFFGFTSSSLSSSSSSISSYSSSSSSDDSALRCLQRCERKKKTDQVFSQRVLTENASIVCRRCTKSVRPLQVVPSSYHRRRHHPCRRRHHHHHHRRARLLFVTASLPISVAPLGEALSLQRDMFLVESNQAIA